MAQRACKKQTSHPGQRPCDALIKGFGHTTVLTHPLIRGEISCGTPPDRTRTLADLAELRHASLATVPETIDFIERQKLYGKGVGFIDFQLLASTVLTAGALLWTADKKLCALARHFNVEHDIAE
ncbi:hypothetical protein AE621_13205 [Acidovorax sp. SD340]|nr:hypothetical protein AE621_13205 [Acidovorax sp. SD340]